MAAWSPALVATAAAAERTGWGPLALPPVEGDGASGRVNESGPNEPRSTCPRRSPSEGAAAAALLRTAFVASSRSGLRAETGAAGVAGAGGAAGSAGPAAAPLRGERRSAAAPPEEAVEGSAVRLRDFVGGPATFETVSNSGGAAAASPSAPSSASSRNDGTAGRVSDPPGDIMAARNTCVRESTAALGGDGSGTTLALGLRRGCDGGTCACACGCGGGADCCGCGCGDCAENVNGAGGSVDPPAADATAAAAAEPGGDGSSLAPPACSAPSSTMS